MRIISLVLLTGFLSSCVDPVVPEYDFTTGLFLVEGQIEDRPGSSEVTISKSETEFGLYKLVPVTGATVISIQTDGPEVSWQQQGESNVYRPDQTFVGQIGKEYILRIITPEGEVIESLPERIPPAVPIGPTRVVFDQESYFNDNLDRFVPAFSVLLDLEDPVGVGNVFQFRYRMWQQLAICRTCVDGRFRKPSCQSSPGDIFDYPCDRPCWSVSTGSTINLLSDAFGDGRTVQDVVAARIDRIGTGIRLVEIEQSAITGAAYDYARIQEDLIAGSGGLNAPLPAALYGNLSMVSGGDVTVLGFVRAASVSTKRFPFIVDSFPGEPLSAPRRIMIEPADIPITAPCEGPDRTSVKPFGWPN